MRTLLLLLITVSLASTANAQSFEAWPAKIKFETKTLDAGIVNEGTVKKVSFSFINDGTEPLIILPYKGSAKGVTVLLPKEPVEPGVKDQVVVEFRARGTGKFRKKIELFTNAQKKPIVLELYGTIN